MQVGDPRRTTQLENRASAIDIGPPRLAIGGGRVEQQAGGVVQHGVAVLVDPFPVNVIETKVRPREVTFDHMGSWQFSTEPGIPHRHQRLNSLFRRHPPISPNHQRQGDAQIGQIANQIPAKQPSATGEQHKLRHCHPAGGKKGVRRIQPDYRT